VDAADAFVRVVACNNEAGDLGVDLVVEIGEDIGREFWATLNLQSFGVGLCFAL
jgi:hypothetical protein